MRMLGVALICLCACKPASTSHSQDDRFLQKMVTQELGEGAEIAKNDSRTFALAFSSRGESVRYILVRLSDSKVVLKGNVRGSITWSGDMQLNESRTPGIVKKDSKPGDFSRTIDLKQFIVQNK